MRYRYIILRMKQAKTYILSDAIRSGKTSALQNWAKKTPNVVGFLTPDIGEKRVFQNIETGKILPMEVEKGDLIVGKYNFDSQSFLYVEKYILKAYHSSGSKYIVLDEIGPLEIKKNLGFHNLLLQLQDNMDLVGPDLFFVVRDYCLEEFLEKYNFKNIETISLNAFKNRFLH